MRQALTGMTQVQKRLRTMKVSNGFPDRSGWRAYSSRDGVLWLSTQESNLFRVDPLRKNIRKITTGCCVHRFLEDNKGNLWIGRYEHGLEQYTRANSNWCINSPTTLQIHPVYLPPPLEPFFRTRRILFGWNTQWCWDLQ